MRVLVTGSRELRDPTVVEELLNNCLAQAELIGENLIVVHGDASRGADRFARDWCVISGVKQEKYPAQWDLFGKSAGFRRNQEMVDTNPVMCLAFPRGEAHGTLHCATAAKKAHIKVIFG